ncbi:MAG: glyoxalase [Ahrensia sp.]|nr:glyoxalase [Ahrensia sp.]|tara:strand:+ start:9675 stop:10046 length:372 start_codon:yes stop_codon:yes gene_type:complete
MQAPNLFLLYVENPEKSAAFYETLFETAPTSVFPSYAAFEFENGTSLGLWSTGARDFVSGGSGHRSEIAFMVPAEDDVRSLHDRWSEAGVAIEQALHDAVFGLTFVAIDPDEHRIRVCMPDKV